MILRKVEEQSRGKRNAVDPLLLVCLRGHLHGEVGNAVGKGIIEALLQLQTFRRGKVCLLGFTAGVHFHGGKHSGAGTEGGIQNIFDKIGGGGLALGTGQPDKGEPLGRVIVIFRCKDRKRLACITDDKSRYMIGIGLLRHIAGGT